MNKRSKSNNGGNRKIGGIYRRGGKGQATVLIAFSIVALIAVIGLAVDGGSMYAQRRNAQNSADAAAMASTEQMLAEYQVMVSQYSDDHNGTALQEEAISNTLTLFANAHGIPRSNLHAYYVNDSKQIVSATEVGQYGGIPWTIGAKGIVVKNTSEVGSYFMKLFGYNTVGASANASAFMGLATDVDQAVGLLPVGFYTDTDHLNNLIPEQEYTLISDSTGSGNWGYVAFNGDGNANVTRTWMTCGYNPSLRTAQQWAEWCPADNNSGALGPTKYREGWSGSPPMPTTGDQTAYSLHWGEGDAGWWLPANTGVANSTCTHLQDVAGSDGKDFLVPVFDVDNGGGGSNLKYHLINLAWFHITSDQITCHGSHLELNGTFKQKYSAGSSGRHGDIRHVSQQTVFLDN